MSSKVSLFSRKICFISKTFTNSYYLQRTELIELHLFIATEILNEGVPSTVEDFEGFGLLLGTHAAVDERIHRQHLERTEIGVSGHHPNEGFVEVVAQTLCTPKTGIVVGNDNWIIFCEESSSWVISHVVDEVQHLIGNRRDLMPIFFFSTRSITFGCFRRANLNAENKYVGLSYIYKYVSYNQ